MPSLLLVALLLLALYLATPASSSALSLSSKRNNAAALSTPCIDASARSLSQSHDSLSPSSRVPCGSPAGGTGPKRAAGQVVQLLSDRDTSNVCNACRLSGTPCPAACKCRDCGGRANPCPADCKCVTCGLHGKRCPRRCRSTKRPTASERAKACWRCAHHGWRCPHCDEPWIQCILNFRLC